jgi:hypothetical protein
MGVSSMCILASFHLIDSGQSVRIKRVVKQEGEAQITAANETAEQVRRLLLHKKALNYFCLMESSLTVVIVNTSSSDSRSFVRCLAKS